MPEFSLSPLVLEPIVRSALLEDLGGRGDITTESIIPAGKKAKAVMRARKGGIASGLDAAALAFRLTDPALKIDACAEGAALESGQTLMTIGGSARAILMAERVALNFVQRLSGVATLTHSMVVAIKGTKARICCTRKTTPNLRVLEKLAVRSGGGVNHRFGLDDGILIKDNHIAVAGSIRDAVERARRRSGHMVRVEVEVDTLDQLKEVLAYDVDAVLLDNMDVPTLKKAVAMVNGRCQTEASGGINAETVRAVAETGVNLISVGALTHSPRSLDIGLDIDV
jgi:nicotinate-nucleotide pyrophosphorylase (carboxylating)